MIEFRYSKHAKDGTPIVSDNDIADYAEELLRDYDPKYLYEPWRLDPLKFTEYYLGAEMDFVDIYCREGEQIAGATVFNREKVRLFDRENMCTRYEVYDPNTILIDNETMEEGKEGFARFTIFHEDGHLCMHPAVYRRFPGQMSLFEFIPAEVPQSVVCCRKAGIVERKTKLVTQEDFREHQANVYSSSITMPRVVFKEIAIDALRKMGCREDYYVLPTLHDTDYDIYADSLASYIGKKFCVSKSAARVQLRKRKLIMTEAELIAQHRQMSFA